MVQERVRDGFEKVSVERNTAVNLLLFSSLDWPSECDNDCIQVATPYSATHCLNSFLGPFAASGLTGSITSSTYLNASVAAHFPQAVYSLYSGSAGAIGDAGRSEVT